MSDIFQEVDEELRRDSVLKLWKQYQNYVSGLAVLIVVATAGVIYWRDLDLQQRQAEGVSYAAALDQARDGKYAEAADALTTLSGGAHTGRALVARFEAAALKARGADEAGAIAAYDAMAKDSSVDELYRGLATVLWGLHAIDTVEPQVIIARLTPIANPENPWHPSAIEIIAATHLKTGDRAAARQDYQKLADDLTAPRGLRARAAELVAALAS